MSRLPVHVYLIKNNVRRNQLSELVQKMFTGQAGVAKLPDICKQTIDAADKMFEDYYASKGAN